MARTCIQRKIPLISGYPAFLMQEDFGLFLERFEDDEKQAELLEQIFWRNPDRGGSPSFDSKGLYTRRETLFDISLSSEWKSFCRHVKTDQTADWEFDNIDLWVRRAAIAMPSGHILFRARAGFDAHGTTTKPYSGVDIGAPPKCAAGRVNEKNQRVL